MKTEISDVVFHAMVFHPDFFLDPAGLYSNPSSLGGPQSTFPGSVCEGSEAVKTKTTRANLLLASQTRTIDPSRSIF